VWVHLIEFLVRTFGLAKSGGFISLALENKAKGGSLLDEVPFEWRSRAAQCGQICAEPQPPLGREGFSSERDAESPHTAAEHRRVLSGWVGRAIRAGHPCPIHQDCTIWRLLVLGNLAYDIGPKRPRRVCAINTQGGVLMRDWTEKTCTHLFGVRIVGVEGSQNVVAHGRRPCGLHMS
jgi:hypothetical protein